MFNVHPDNTTTAPQIQVGHSFMDEEYYLRRDAHHRFQSPAHRQRVRNRVRQGWAGEQNAYRR
jgi:hypothetical protein